MISIALGVVKTLVLLVPAVVCLASPETVQRMALQAGRKHGLSRPWQEGLLTVDFLWSIRLCGGILLFLASLLAFTLLRGT